MILSTEAQEHITSSLKLDSDFCWENTSGFSRLLKSGLFRDDQKLKAILLRDRFNTAEEVRDFCDGILSEEKVEVQMKKRFRITPENILMIWRVAANLMKHDPHMLFSLNDVFERVVDHAIAMKDNPTLRDEKPDRDPIPPELAEIDGIPNQDYEMAMRLAIMNTYTELDNSKPFLLSDLLIVVMQKIEKGAYIEQPLHWEIEARLFGAAFLEDGADSQKQYSLFDAVSILVAKKD